MIRRHLIVGIALWAGLAKSAPAQTTDTERAAARDVVREIEALQARIGPTQLAQRLAGRKDADRDRLLARVDQLWLAGMCDLSDHIGKNPEVGFQEFKAVDTLTA
ncbi:MAG TPA: hypothetical protein VD793_10865, partial [Gemmatimonadales bacterium]|nr:hypothetical protein [Gemmatimonadales bacterium]